DLGGDGGGARGAQGPGRRALRRSLRGGAPARPLRGGRRARRPVRHRRADRGAAGHARRGRRPRPAAAPRPAPLRAVPRRRGALGARRAVTRLAITRLRPEAVIPARAYAGDAGLDLAACERVELAPGERKLVPTGLAVAIPEGHAGFVQPRSGLAARHGITIVNTPGLVDSGYRGELKVILLNTDPSEPF